MSDIDRLRDILAKAKRLSPRRGRRLRMSPEEWQQVFTSGVSIFDAYSAMLENYVAPETPFYATFISFKQAAYREKARLRRIKHTERALARKLREAKEICRRFGVEFRDEE